MDSCVYGEEYSRPGEVSAKVLRQRFLYLGGITRRPVQWERRGGEGVSGIMGHRLSRLCGLLRGLRPFPHGNGGTVEQRKARVD